MADQKISDLTALTVLASDDEFAVVDTSESASNKVTLSVLTDSGLKTKLTSNNTLVYKDDGGVVGQVALAERDTLYRAAAGTLVGNNGRNFLDNCMRGPTGIATAYNYQPHYVEYWHGTGASASASWPSGGVATGIGAVYYYYSAAAGTASLRLPVASSANAGDSIHICNRSLLHDYLPIIESTTLVAPDEDDAGDGAKASTGGWRLYYGDFLILHCKQNEEDSGYNWYQVGGTPLEGRKELFVTATGLDFASTGQYCPGEVTVRVTADAQTFNLPSATERRYRFRFYMASGTDTHSATIAVESGDTITAPDSTDTGNTSATVGSTNPGAFVELWTQGDGVWHAIADSECAYS